MDGFFDLEIELSGLDREYDSLLGLFTGDIGENYETASRFQPEAFFESVPQDVAIDSFDSIYMEMALEQSSEAIEQTVGEQTIDKALFTVDGTITTGTIWPDAGPDMAEFFEIWLLLAALGGLAPVPASTGDTEDDSDEEDEGDPTTIAVPIPTPPGGDPDATWGTLLSLIPEFDMLGFNLDALITLINNPGGTSPTTEPSCVLPVTPAGGNVPLDQLSETHANALTDFLSAMGASAASSSIGGTIPGNYHAHNESTSFTLGDLSNILSDITMVSADIDYDFTDPIRTGGHFNFSTHVLTIGNHITDFSDIIQIIVHEALHAYIDLTPSLTHVIDHGQFGVTSQEHQAWFEQIVDDLIAQLEANVIGGIEGNADCS